MRSVGNTSLHVVQSQEIEYLKLFILFLSCNYDYLNICSSAKYFFKDRVSSPEDSELRPNGFSTINLVQPVEVDAVRLADLTTSTNMFGGMDR